MSGLGHRLDWCERARPQPWTAPGKSGRTVSAAMQKLVLWTLTNHANADGSSDWRQKKLAEEACLPRPSFNAAAIALEAQDFIEIEPHPERARLRVYRVRVDLSLDVTGRPGRSVTPGDSTSDLPVTPGDSNLSPGVTLSVTSGDRHKSKGFEPPLEPPPLTKDIAPDGATSITHAPRDELFEATCEATGIRWQTRARWTKNFSDRVNAAVGQLRDAGYEPDEVREAARRYLTANPPGTPLTIFALTTQIPQLLDGETPIADGAALQKPGGRRGAAMERHLARAASR